MDFSLTTLFVVPSAQSALPTTGSTDSLTAGQLGIYRNDYTPATAGNIAAAKWFQIAQGRLNTHLLASKRSDKIHTNRVTEWYKVNGCSTPANQITEVSGWSVKCGEKVTLTLRAHSSYIDTLYFNGLTRSVTVNAPCCDCGADPCVDVDVPALIDQLIAKLEESTSSPAPDNISFNTFFLFERVGDDANAKLVIHGKPLTKYGNPCDIAAFPFEYDRMFFRTFVYEGPATTADFLVDNSCTVVATAAVVQHANFATGTSEEIAQLENNYYSYQAGYMKHLHRMAGYNQNFEQYVEAGKTYSTFYIKFNEFDKSEYKWGDYIEMDSMVIIAVEAGSAFETALQTALEAALGAVNEDNTCLTTTTTVTTAAPTTTTTTTV